MKKEETYSLHAGKLFLELHQQQPLFW